MASENRSPTIDLISSHLGKNARYYAFGQAVDLIQSRLDSGREVGTHVRAVDERIYFEVTSSLGFPTSDVTAIRPMWLDEEGKHRGQDYGRFVVNVAFLGLHGSSSPLPSYYPERIAQFDERGSVMKGFLDFFHHRTIGLLHRSSRKYRYYALYQPGGVDRFSRWVYSLFGLNDEEIRTSTRIYWPRLLCFAGILATRNRSPSVLASVIAHAFHLQRVEIEEWVRRKVDIPRDQLWSLGCQNSTLGQQTVLGNRAPDIQGKLRVVLHDLDYNRFRDFLPRGKDYLKLKNLLEFMLRDQFAYDFKLCLAPSQAKPLSLRAEEQGRLGWSSFVGEGFRNDVREVVIQARI